MGDLSKNFSRMEFACFDGCGFDTADIELVNVLEGIRENFGGMPVTITPKGGCRCLKQNVSSGGVANSQHMKGRAADIQMNGVPPKLIHRYLTRTYPGKFGIGLYENFVHIDTRSDGPARWGIVNDLS